MTKWWDPVPPATGSTIFFKEMGVARRRTDEPKMVDRNWDWEVPTWIRDTYYTFGEDFTRKLLLERKAEAEAVYRMGGGVALEEFLQELVKEWGDEYDVHACGAD